MDLNVLLTLLLTYILTISADEPEISPAAKRALILNILNDLNILHDIPVRNTPIVQRKLHEAAVDLAIKRALVGEELSKDTEGGENAPRFERLIGLEDPNQAEREAPESPLNEFNTPKHRVPTPSFLKPTRKSPLGIGNPNQFVRKPDSVWAFLNFGNQKSTPEIPTNPAAVAPHSPPASVILDPSASSSADLTSHQNTQTIDSSANGQQSISGWNSLTNNQDPNPSNTQFFSNDQIKNGEDPRNFLSGYSGSPTEFGLASERSFPTEGSNSNGITNQDANLITIQSPQIPVASTQDSITTPGPTVQTSPSLNISTSANLEDPLSSLFNNMLQKSVLPFDASTPVSSPESIQEEMPKNSSVNESTTGLSTTHLTSNTEIQDPFAQFLSNMLNMPNLFTLDPNSDPVSEGATQKPSQGLPDTTSPGNKPFDPLASLFDNMLSQSPALYGIDSITATPNANTLPLAPMQIPAPVDITTASPLLTRAAVDRPGFEDPKPVIRSPILILSTTPLPLNSNNQQQYRIQNWSPSDNTVLPNSANIVTQTGTTSQSSNSQIVTDPMSAARNSNPVSPVPATKPNALGPGSTDHQSVDPQRTPIDNDQSTNMANTLISMFTAPFPLDPDPADESDKELSEYDKLFTAPTIFSMDSFTEPNSQSGNSASKTSNQPAPNQSYPNRPASNQPIPIQPSTGLIFGTIEQPSSIPIHIPSGAAQTATNQGQPLKDMGPDSGTDSSRGPPLLNQNQPTDNLVPQPTTDTGIHPLISGMISQNQPERPNQEPVPQRTTPVRNTNPFFNSRPFAGTSKDWSRNNPQNSQAQTNNQTPTTNQWTEQERMYRPTYHFDPVTGQYVQSNQYGPPHPARPTLQTHSGQHQQHPTSQQPSVGSHTLHSHPRSQPPIQPPAQEAPETPEEPEGNSWSWYGGGDSSSSSSEED